MKLSRLLYGGQTLIEEVPVIHGGTAINVGALVMKGATPGTNNGAAIIGAPTYANTIGLTMEPVASTASDTTIAGTVYSKYKVCVNPDAIFMAEYDQSTTISGTSSGTALTVSSLEDNIDAGWIFVVSGTSTDTTGELRYITASASGGCTLKTAFSTNLDGTEKLIKILPKYHKLVDLNTAADKIKTAAAAGTGKLQIIANYFSADGIAITELDPVKHSGLKLTGAKFYSELLVKDNIYRTGS